MQVSAVVFDLDDTLFPERTFVESGMQAVAEWIADRYDVDQAAILTEFSRLERSSQGRVFDVWIEQHPFDLSAATLIEVYRQHKPSIRPFAGTRSMLKELTGRQYSLGVISDGYLQTQINKFAALGLAEFFEARAVVFSDRFGRHHWKPSPIPYRTALDALEVSPARAVYVGDNPTKDFAGARAVGMKSIRLATNGGVYSQLSPATANDAADVNVLHTDDIVSAVESLQET